jgi:hypothetical protein
MTVRIRLESSDRAELDAHVGALQVVLDVVGEASRDFPNRNGGGGVRRYVVSAGPRMSAATAAAVHGAHRPDGVGVAPLAAAENAKHRRDIGGEVGALIAADQDLKAQPWMPIQAGDVVLCYLPAGDGAPAYGVTYVAVDDPDDLDEVGARLRPVSTTVFASSEKEPVPEFLLVREDSGGWRLDASFGSDDLELLQRPDRPLGGLLAAQAWATRVINDDQVDGDPALVGWAQHGDAGWVPLFDDAVATASNAAVSESFYDVWFESPPGALTVIRAGAVVFGQPAAVR